MPYISRDNQGQIVAVSIHQSLECAEWVDEEDQAFKLALVVLSGGTLESINSDLAMVRVIEDLIEILTAKSVISLTEFPPAVQLKLLARNSLRKNGDWGMNATDLIRL
jgi:hypothetical protein